MKTKLVRPLLVFCIMVVTSCGAENNNGVNNSEDEEVTLRDLKSLCDGGEGLALMVKTTSQRAPSSIAIWNENGNRFIHVNRKCQFWVWGDIIPFSGNWATGSRVKTGTLNDEQGIILLKTLMFKRWKSVDKTWFSSGFSHSKIEYFSKNSKFAFSGRDGSVEGKLREQLQDGFVDALELLFEIGVPMEQDELRLLISEGADNRLYDKANPTYFVNWEYHMSVEDFASLQSPYCNGDSILLKGDDALHFKSEREKWLEASKETPGLFIAVKGTTGEHAYYFSLRDVLPYEDKNGVVSFDEVEPVEICY